MYKIEGHSSRQASQLLDILNKQGKWPLSKTEWAIG